MNLVPGTAAPRAGNFPVLEGYIPMRYAGTLLEKARDNCILPKLVNRDYEGDLRSHGDTLTIRKTPDIQAFDYRIGTPIEYQAVNVDAIEWAIRRCTIAPFKVNKIQERLSDINGFVSTWSSEAAKSLAEVKERKFFKDVPSRSHAKNQGNNAGLISESYDLGSVANPLKIVKAGAVEANHEANAPDAITYANAALQEQPGGIGDDAYIVIPPVFAQRIQTSEMKDASLTGDAVTLLRKDVIATGVLSNFTVYVSNFCPMSMVAGKRQWTCLFGDRRGITYADQISSIELKQDPYVAEQWNHSTLEIYDWFVVRPYRIGAMVITI